MKRPFDINTCHEVMPNDRQKSVSDSSSSLSSRSKCNLNEKLTSSSGEVTSVFTDAIKLSIREREGKEASINDWVDWVDEEISEAELVSWNSSNQILPDLSQGNIIPIDIKRHQRFNSGTSLSSQESQTSSNDRFVDYGDKRDNDLGSSSSCHLIPKIVDTEDRQRYNYSVITTNYSNDRIPVSCPSSRTSTQSEYSLVDEEITTAPTSASLSSYSSEHLPLRIGKAILSSLPLSLIAKVLSYEKRKKKRQQEDQNKQTEGFSPANTQTTFREDKRISFTPQNDLQLVVLMVTIGIAFGTQNLIAPNMTVIANYFKFTQLERDRFIGGELTFLFYTPGIIGAFIIGFISTVVARRKLFCTVVSLTALSCFLTTFVRDFNQLAVVRTLTGLSMGGMIPLAYSLIGDWFPPWKRSSASAFLMGSCGVGSFGGQMVAATLGVIDWRLPFLVISIPALVMGLLFPHLVPHSGDEDSNTNGSSPIMPSMSLVKQISRILSVKTNILMLLLAFPGNIPWGVLIIYLHDFLKSDMGLTNNRALAVVSIVAFFSFCGMITGGFIGEFLYKLNRSALCLYCAFINLVRIFPFIMIFGMTQHVVNGEDIFTIPIISLLIIGGFASTLASSNVGAIILNVNPQESRCTIFGMLTVLDDLSKALGSVMVSYLIYTVANRRFAFQIAMCMWCITSLNMLLASFTFPQDEDNLIQQNKLQAWDTKDKSDQYYETIPIVKGRHISSAFAKNGEFVIEDPEFGLSERGLARL